MNKIINLGNKNNTAGFGNHPENINKDGRPKKIYTVLIEQGYSKDDIRTAFSELQWYTIEELENLHKDESKPIITRIIANQFIQALTKNDWNKIKDIIEMTIGKAKQSIDVETDHQITEIRLMEIHKEAISSIFFDIPEIENNH